MIQALIGPIANLAGSWFENKIAKTKADGQAKVAEAKARASVILVFIPSMREYVKEGFAVLADLPDWYQYLLYIAVSASFGIKGVGQAAKMIKGKK